MNDLKLTPTQARLRDAMVTAVDEGRWVVVSRQHGLMIRWSSAPLVPHELLRDLCPGPTYQQHVFLTMTPRPVLGTAPAPWVGRRDSDITYTLAMAILDDPKRALT